MALEAYRAKRNFSRTTEPAGPASPAAGGTSFVIQKHAARRLHYDLRLELDGVLKSWAVTVGPSLVAGEKRLAVETEDHPLDYASFEGDIPQGEYGGGNVIVWDRGVWTPKADARAGLKKGHLRFTLDGVKLGGAWDLVRMKPRPGEKHTPWLLIKVDDAFARAPDAPDILVEQPGSVLSGPSEAKAKAKAPAKRKSARAGDASEAPREPKTPAKTRTKKALPDAPPAAIEASTIPGAVAGKLPAFIEPELATLALKPPVGAQWSHEVKFDGYRLQARISRGKVELKTRSGLDWTAKFRDVAIALQTVAVETAIIDGEVVVETERGHSSFSALQADLTAGRSDGMTFYAFDLLHLNGFDTRKAAQRDRKAALATLFPADACGRLRLSADFESDGALLLRHACRLGLEGIVSKRADAPYRSGRNAAWVKSKCSNRQEFVIVGYTRSSTARQAVGSLALGVYDGETLVFAGRAGTGFDAESSAMLWERLEAIRRVKTAVDRFPEESNVSGLRWAEPRLVVEAEFREWTGPGHVRHAVYQGLREDKDARAVVRETVQDVVSAPAQRAVAVKLTHPDRIYWADVGISKQGLADYYSAVWDRIAPHVVKRPLALLRCPGGTAEACFFQKHGWAGMDGALVQAAEFDEQPFLSIETFDGLVALVQAGALELHSWGAPVAQPDNPDMLCFDLDPADDVEWLRVEQGARLVRDALAGLGLRSFLKTSGGKGLHVMVPLDGKANWSTAKAFAKRVAEDAAKDAPREFVAVMSKEKRRGRIFLDYLRNGRGSTAVVAYSTRARAGAAVSTPISWDELGAGVTSQSFTVATLPRRLAAIGADDPWGEMGTVKQGLPKSR